MTIAPSSEASWIRVVLAEDHALARRATALLLSLAPDMECVGQACDGAEAVRLADILRPDVVLMDLQMPVKDGIAATREITLANPATSVLLLTAVDDEEAAFAAVRAGARAYLLKDCSAQELLETIRALHRGESRLTPQIARRIMDQFRHLAQSDGLWQPPSSVIPAADSRVAGGLTDREERVLYLIAEGTSESGIANVMAVADITIKSDVSSILQKLRANTRTEQSLYDHK